MSPEEIIFIFSLTVTPFGLFLQFVLYSPVWIRIRIWNTAGVYILYFTPPPPLGGGKKMPAKAWGKNDFDIDKQER